jgi:hypothetical protein
VVRLVRVRGTGNERRGNKGEAMGSNRYHIKGLRDAGDGLTRGSHRLRNEWQQLDGHVQSQGDIFGDDDVGGLLAMAYDIIHNRAGESYTQAADDFDALGAGLKGLGDSYDDLEQQHVQSLDVIGRALDGLGSGRS